MLHLQNLLQLLGSPPLMQPTLGQNQGLHRPIGPLRKLMRTMTAKRQPFQALRSIAIQIFIASLAADAELFTQLAHRKSRTLRQHYKSNDLFHRGYSFPRHDAWKCNPSLRFVCYLSLRIVPAGLSVRELARQIGESNTNVSYWERSGQIPRSDVLAPMAKALGVTVHELLGEPRPGRLVVPGGRLGQVFDQVTKLPRRQQ